jgi:hypothetical protein
MTSPDEAPSAPTAVRAARVAGPVVYRGAERPETRRAHLARPAGSGIGASSGRTAVAFRQRSSGARRRGRDKAWAAGASRLIVGCLLLMACVFGSVLGECGFDHENRGSGPGTWPVSSAWRIFGSAAATLSGKASGPEATTSVAATAPETTGPELVSPGRRRRSDGRTTTLDRGDHMSVGQPPLADSRLVRACLLNDLKGRARCVAPDARVEAASLVEVVA